MIFNRLRHKNQSGFMTLKTSLVAVAITATALSGGAIASNVGTAQNSFIQNGSVSAAAEESPADFCVTSYLANDPEIKSERGACSPDVGGETPGDTNPEIKDTITKLVYQCDETSTGRFQFVNVSEGSTLTFTDGTTTETIAEDTWVTLNGGVRYEVTLDGTYERVDLDERGGKVQHCVREVLALGEDTGVTVLRYFGDNVTKVPANIPSSVVDITSIFYNNRVINDPNISLWDVSNVTNMNGAFGEADSFNQPLNSWNVSNVEIMHYMFAGNDAFNQPLDKWDVSKVKTIDRMFEHSAFNQPLSAWKTDSLENASSPFDGSAFDQDISNWNVSKVYEGSFTLKTPAYEPTGWLPNPNL